MIIQCPKCLAKFKMDDSKVKDEGTKVRCSKCKEVFVVAREEAAPAAMPPQPETASEKQDLDFSFGPSGEEGEKEQTSSFAFGDFDEEASRKDEGGAAEFSFGDESRDEPETKEEEEKGGVDWGGMAYGEVSFSEQAAEEKPAESKATVGFDFNEGPPEISFGGDSTIIESPRSGETDYKGEATLIAPPPMAEKEKFKQEAPKPLLFADEGPAIGFEEERFEEEFPSETKKEKRRSLVNIILSVVIISSIAAGGLWYFWKSHKTAESGEITLAELNGYYAENAEAGNIFVVEGKVVNNTNRPRSFFQVRGTLFNKDGKKLTQKSSYCGNIYASKEISTMTRTKIEDDMKNKYGPSLSNVNVAPGKFVKFTMIFFDLPADMSEFTVEVSGSEIASE